MELLAEAALRVTVLALGVAAVLRVLRLRSPRLLHIAWTAVVVTMLLMPALLVWGPRFAVPVLSGDASRGTRVVLARTGASAGPQAMRTSSTAATAATRGPRLWMAVTGTVYVSGVAVLLLRLVLGLRRARAIRRGAMPARERLTHAACVTPITVGLLSPTVILPPDWPSWDPAERSAVFAHEDEHVRRRDPLVAAVALFNRAIFWFHPLAWWLPQTISRLSEQACDAAVIARGYDRDVYMSCLLRFARRVADANGRMAPLSSAMPGAGLTERLGMLTRPQGAQPSGSRLAGAVVTCAALLVVCAAAVPTAKSMQGGGSNTANQRRWTVHMSNHFEIFHDGLSTDRVDEAARQAEAAYETLSAALKYETPGRVTLILVSRDRDLDATVLRPLDLPPSGDAARRRVVISLESLDRRGGLIVHELTHQFAFEIVPGTSRVVPVLIEGLAEHQRGQWPPQDLRRTREGAAAGAIPAVASLGPADRHWAHAVFDFVAVEHGAEGIRRLLFALRAHDTLDQAVPTAFGVSLEEFDQDFRGFVAARFNPRFSR